MQRTYRPFHPVSRKEKRTDRKDMKKSFLIFRRDMYRLTHNLVALIVTIGIAALPSLYAWFNIAANMDPYSNTSGIRVAVANEDAGTETDLIGALNAGDQIETQLKENDSLGWEFVSSEEAKEGVRAGEYYAAIIIPSSFSSDMVSVLSGNLDQPKLEYYINEKKNAIAPKVTSTGASTIQQQVNDQFVKAASAAVSEALDESMENLEGEVEETGSVLLRDLEQASANLAQYQQALESFRSMKESSSAALKGLDETISGASDTAKKAMTVLEDSNDALTAARKGSSQAASSTSEVLSEQMGVLSDLRNSADSRLNTLDTGLSRASVRTDETLASLQSTLNKQQQILSELKTINERLPGHAADAVIERLETELQSQQNLLTALQEGNQSIHQSVSAVSQMKDGIGSALQSEQNSLRSVQSTLTGSLFPSISSSLDRYPVLTGRLQSVLTPVESQTVQLQEAVRQMEQSLDDIDQALASTGDSLTRVQGQLDTMKSDLQLLQNSDDYQKLLESFTSDSDTVSSFFASPVELKTESFYEVKNYGSAMSPFYTNLALWVGGIMLISVFHLEVDRDRNIGSMKPREGYFGRWLLFVTMALVQAFIACMGDLLLLHVQAVHPVLFVFTGMFASFVYTNLIYALSKTFKHIGKALCVILVILQIPASTGTYPVEMTPGFFQILKPVLPFTYGINMMRETVAGMYGSHFMVNMGLLALFVPVSLFIGLVLRPLLLSLHSLVDERLEQSGLIESEVPCQQEKPVHLAYALRILTGDDMVRNRITQRAESFERHYPKLIKGAFLSIFIIPVTFLVLMFSMSWKMLCLVLWIISIIVIVVFIIIVEFIHERMKEQKELSAFSDEELMQMIRNTENKEAAE